MTFILSFLFIVLIGISELLSHNPVLERGTNTTCHLINPLLTIGNGAPVDDMLASQSAGAVGPLVLQDTVLIEGLANLVREKIPERIIFSKGTGAFGVFTVTNTSFTQYCKASLFESIGKETEVFVRFSSEHEAGSCETLRGMRGGSIKFYTDDGNFDIVGGNSPIFFIRDPLLFPSLVHVLKRNPVTNLRDSEMFWDFMTMRPESIHQLLFMFSDRGLPDGYRHMNIYGTNTFKVVNKEGTPFYCKFQFRTNQGVKNLDPATGENLCGSKPDYATEDLVKSISKKENPTWTMYYQVMTFQEAVSFKWNPFDVTKIWPQSEFPVQEIGRFTLDKLPTDYFDQVEQAAFSPSNLVPGIEPSPDKMFQGRMFAYPDAQRYRLGVNYQKLPINAPKVPVSNYQRNGRMSFDSGTTVHPNYFPNTVKGSGSPCPAAKHSQWNISGDVARHNSDNQDNFGQAKTFYAKTLNDEQRERLATNIVNSLKHVSHTIKTRAVSFFKSVHLDLAHRVSALVNLGSY